MMNEKGCGRGGDEQVELLEKQDKEEEGEEGVGILQVTDCVCVCVCAPGGPMIEEMLRRYPLRFTDDG